MKAVLGHFIASRVALAAALLLLLLLGLALAAPLVSPQDPYDLLKLDLMDSRQAPMSQASGGGMTYLLGTDDQGRDMLSAILHGLRISLFVGLAGTGIALLLGSALGLLAAWTRGWVDALVMRIADMQLTFPAILIALVLLAVLGPGVGKIIAALAAVQWAYYARTVRSAALGETSRDYIAAAQCLAIPRWRILFRHLLPNCMAPLVVVATMQVASAIALEATLSFLGLGLPVTEPSLGLLIANGFTYLLSGKYWISLFPGVALLLLIVCINLVGDRLRDVLNPRYVT